MNKTLFLSRGQNGVFQFSAEEQQKIATALESHGVVSSWAAPLNDFLNHPAVAAFDWTKLLGVLSPLLSVLGAFIPGLGPILALLPNINKLIDLFNQIAALFNIKPIPPVPPIPVPIPVPGGGGFIPVTPV